MQINRLVKFLNNTELGKGGMHDRYILIPKAYDVSSVFPNMNTDYTFKSKKNDHIEYIIRIEKGRETRITKMGTYYQKHDLEAGDAIILEKINNNYRIDHIKKTDNIVLQKVRNKGFEILKDGVHLSSTRNSHSSTCYYDNSSYEFDFKFTKSEKKRANSPNSTSFYSLVLTSENGLVINMLDEIANNEIIELIKINESFYIKKLDILFKQELTW